MYDDSVHSGLTTVSQFVPSIFLSAGLIYGVKVALGNRGMTVEAARQCPRDRKEWRTLYICNWISSTRSFYFEVGEVCLCGHFCVASLLLCICSPYPSVLFFCVGVCCWMSSSASWAPSVFGGQALSLWGFAAQRFLVVVSSTSCCSICMLYKVKFELNHCLFS